MRVSAGAYRCGSRGRRRGIIFLQVGRTEARLVTGRERHNSSCRCIRKHSGVSGCVPQLAFPAETGCLSGMGCGGRASCTMRGSGGKVQLWTRSNPADVACAFARSCAYVSTPTSLKCRTLPRTLIWDRIPGPPDGPAIRATMIGSRLSGPGHCGPPGGPDSGT